MPPTRGVQRYQKLLGVVSVGSIVGITLSVSAILGILFDGPFVESARAWKELVKNGVMLCGWCIIAWIAHRGRRHNLAPPEWLVLGVALLVWVVILL